MKVLSLTASLISLLLISKVHSSVTRIRVTVDLSPECLSQYNACIENHKASDSHICTQNLEQCTQNPPAEIKPEPYSTRHQTQHPFFNPEDPPLCTPAEILEFSNNRRQQPLSGLDDFDCTNKLDGNYPNPKDCGSFFSCSGEVKWICQCPDNLSYNPNSNKCEYPDIANCPY